MSYRVFDLPAHGGNFDARVPAIRETVAAIGDPWVVAIRQFHVPTKLRCGRRSSACSTGAARGWCCTEVMRLTGPDAMSDCSS
jgi:hypothetical protein